MVASTPARSDSETRRAWVNVALAAWLIAGVYLVARATTQGLIPSGGFSLYPAPAYAGLVALAVYVVTSIGGAVRRRRPWRAAFEGGYEYLPLGFVILLAYTAIDTLWQLLFGLDKGIESAIAPSRLLLPVGLALVAIGPARVALAGAPGVSKLAGVVAIGLALAAATFSIGGFHPLVGGYAERPLNSTEDDSEIWVMAADGTAQTRVIQAGDGIEVSLPVWSPDGTRIAYTRWSPSTKGGVQGDVWVADATGRNATPLTTGDATEWIPAWSPDGAWIAYTAEPETGPRPAAGAAAEGPRPGGAPGVGSPQQASAQTWAVHPDGSGRHQLTEVERGATSASWSSDGTRLVFNNDRTGDTEIYVIDVDGSNERRLTADPAEDWAPAWSPDGTRIVFGSTRTGDNEVWMVGADGTGLTRLTTDPADDDVPVWSPDGTRIAFVSTRTGDAEIWTMDPDGGDLRNLTRRPSADDGRWSVHWSPDGRSLVYASAGLGPAATQPIVFEDLAVAGVLLFSVAFAIAAMIGVSIGLSFGTVAIVVAIDGLLAASITDGWRFVPSIVVAALVVDLILARTPARRRRQLAAVLTPAAVVLGYGLTLLAMGSSAWSSTLLLGTALAAALIGWVIGALLPTGEPA
jgi:Tol biopolymer transport system component